MSVTRATSTSPGSSSSPDGQDADSTGRDARRGGDPRELLTRRERVAGVRFGLPRAGEHRRHPDRLEPSPLLADAAPRDRVRRRGDEQLVVGEVVHVGRVGEHPAFGQAPPRLAHREAQGVGDPDRGVAHPLADELRLDREAARAPAPSGRSAAADRARGRQIHRLDDGLEQQLGRVGEHRVLELGLAGAPVAVVAHQRVEASARTPEHLAADVARARRAACDRGRIEAMLSSARARAGELLDAEERLPRSRGVPARSGPRPPPPRPRPVRPRRATRRPARRRSRRPSSPARAGRAAAGCAPRAARRSSP